MGLPAQPKRPAQSALARDCGRVTDHCRTLAEADNPQCIPAHIARQSMVADHAVKIAGAMKGAVMVSLYGIPRDIQFFKDRARQLESVRPIPFTIAVLGEVTRHEHEVGTLGVEELDGCSRHFGGVTPESVNCSSANRVCRRDENLKRCRCAC